jgi:uncharacterized membrane protein
VTLPKHHGHPVTRALKRIAPLHFLLFLALLPAAFLLHGGLLGPTDWRDSAAIAFDVAAAAFLLTLVPLLDDEADVQAMRAHAAENDANRGLILALTTVMAFAVLAAMAGELPGARTGDPLTIAKLIGTLALVWLFANAVYALHYAHAYYLPHRSKEGDAGGIDFPGTRTPGYSDFAYFSFTLGMTFQTSDVAITTPGIRRIVLLHSIGAFVFNIGVIAFAINVLGGASG